ncbi:MAG TPA: hypothetical protein VHO03_09800 [Ignavibacteriales bacterium]|nr:hypothetical protein [Ignavibacteriales bacterium]
MKRLLILIYLILMFIFPEILFSETPEQNPQAKNPPPRPESACIVSSWHYEPVEGKIIGIWPPSYYWTKEALKNLTKKYGFTGISIRQDEINPDSMYQWAIRAGFKPENMMVNIINDTYTSRIVKMPAAFYYLDEPVEHNCSGHATNGTRIYSPDELEKIRDYIHTNRPDAKFIIGGYKRCSHLKIAVDIADGVMYSSYVNWNSMWLPVCHANMGFGDDVEAPWAEGSGLQTDSWGDMRSKFREKFSMTWMHGKNDECQELFKTANSLGLNGIWLYANEGVGPDSAASLEKFCQAAAQNGWLKIVDDYLPAPDSLTACKAEDGHSIRLDWKDMSDNEKGFVIERKLSSSNTFTQLTTVGAGSFTFIDSSVEDGKVYSYRIKAFNDYNTSDYSNEALISSVTSTGKIKELIPVDFTLFQNYPNPYNPSTRIGYSLPGQSRVRLLIYNSIGGIVKILSDRVEDAGYHEIDFNASGFSSGIYFYSMEASAVSGQGSYHSARKMLLLK